MRELCPCHSMDRGSAKPGILPVVITATLWPMMVPMLPEGHIVVASGIFLASLRCCMYTAASADPENVPGSATNKMVVTGPLGRSRGHALQASYRLRRRYKC